MIVCNTSPIFYLHKIGLLNLPEKLFGEVFIPQAVVSELDEGKRLGYGAPDVREFNWLKVRAVEVPSEIRDIGIGDGETEAIALALKNEVKFLLLDDGEARRAALERKLPVVGTVGVLIMSVRQGFLPKLKPSLEALSSSGFRISQQIQDKALESVGEK